MHNLTFRTTGRQLRNLLIGAVVITVLGAGTGVVVADHAGRGGGPLASAIGLAIAALIYLYALVAYAVARTECTPTEIRTRGLRGRRSCRWTDVRDISVRHGTSRIVIVTTADGRRFWLGVPVDGGIMPDPDLASKVTEIRAYWHAVETDSPEGAGAPVWWLREDRRTSAPLSASTGRVLKVLAAISAPWVLLSCALVFAIVISPLHAQGHRPGLVCALGPRAAGHLHGRHAAVRSDMLVVWRLHLPQRLHENECLVRQRQSHHPGRRAGPRNRHG